MTEDTPRSSTTRLRLRSRPTFGPPQAQPQNPLNLLVGTRLVELVGLVGRGGGVNGDLVAEARRACAAQAARLLGSCLL